MLRRIIAAIAVTAALTTVALHTLTIADRATNLDVAAQGEGLHGAFVVRWMREPPSVAWLEDVPFTGSAYGPLMFAVWRGAAALAPAADLLLVGRLVALTASVGLVVIVASVVFRTQRSAIATAASVAVLAASPVTDYWFPLARVDTLAAALTAAAYVSFGGSTHRVAGAAGLLVLATLAKQSAAVHVLPIAWLAFAMGGLRLAGTWTLTVSLLACALWGVTLASYEHYFVEAAFFGNLNRAATVWRFVEVTHVWLRSPSTVLVMIAASGWMVLDREDAMRNRWWMGFWVATLTGIVTSLKEGSSLNYFLDATWLGAIIAGHVTGHLLRHFQFATALGIALAATVSIPSLALGRHASGWWGPRTQERAIFIAQVAKGRSVLLDGNLVTFAMREPGLLVNDPFLFRLRADRGRAPVDALLDALKSPSSIVILSRSVKQHELSDRTQQHWPRQVLKAVASDYCLAEQRHGVWVYRHRGSVEGCMPDPRERPTAARSHD